MRQTPTLFSLLDRLRTDPSFSTAAHVRLVDYDWPDWGTHWRSWTFPRALEAVRLCDLEAMPGCDAVCRGGKDAAKSEEDWPSFEELALVESGW
jgi:hypothetical protein